MDRTPIYCADEKATKGFVKSYRNLHFYWILGAGHYVSTSCCSRVTLHSSFLLMVYVEWTIISSQICSFYQNYQVEVVFIVITSEIRFTFSFFSWFNSPLILLFSVYLKGRVWIFIIKICFALYQLVCCTNKNGVMS